MEIDCQHYFPVETYNEEYGVVLVHCGGVRHWRLLVGITSQWRHIMRSMFLVKSHIMKSMALFSCIVAAVGMASADVPEYYGVLSRNVPEYK